ncbi:MAG: hypothetical protein ACTTGJ_03850 [Clostridium sp.]
MNRKKDLTIKEYEKKVIESLMKGKHSQEYIQRFKEYEKTGELKKDIACDYAIRASVDACAYNLYMWI